MDWTSVTSSNIEKIGYDEKTHTMGAVFKSGGTYHYADVPKDVYDAVRGADSVGKALAQHVKGKYSHTKVGG